MSSPPWFKEPPSWSSGNGADGANMPPNRTIRLHREIFEFSNRIMPTPKEQQMRTAAVQRVAEVTRSLWPDSEVRVFGSVATGLYLPTSDIDVIILNSGSGTVLSRLRALETHLNKANIARNVDVKGRAKVPIMKFEDRESRLTFDVGLETRKEVEAVEMIKDSVRGSLSMAPLYRVLKLFFQQKHLNEVYHTGGMNSYTVFVMLRFFLQIHPDYSTPQGPSGEKTVNLNFGVLLLGFFHFYGRSVNVREYGITCSDGGRFLKKSELGFVDTSKPFLLAAQDPLVPTIDVGKCSFNFPRIQAAFLEAYNQLTRSPDDGSSSLHRILSIAKIR